MNMKALWTIVIVLFGVTMLFGMGLNAGSDAALDTYNVTEGYTVDYTNNTTVANADAEALSDTITVVVNDTTLEDGTDYAWDSDSGTINWINTTATSDGDTASVTYEYDDYPETTQFSIDLVNIMIPVITLLVIGVAARFAFGGAY